MEDQKLTVVELGNQTIRRKFRIGPLRPRLDLKLTNPVVSGLDSLTRTSEAVMEYSEVDELPNFNVKFNAQVSNIKTKVAAKGTVSEIVVAKGTVSEIPEWEALRFSNRYFFGKVGFFGIFI